MLTTSHTHPHDEPEHPHVHTHDHDHPHTHDHPHDHDHPHGGLWGTIASALHLPGYAHTHQRPSQNDTLFNNELGIRTVKLALLSLGVTTLIQVAIVIASGSVALLADTVHNLGDALNSIPLWIAFVLARRVANRRYTYGYGRAEDVAGLLIVVSIAFSAGYAIWESLQKLIHPAPISNLAWVATAAVVGFIGNELVATMQIRVGRQIGSAAMVADGLHARTDGLTSLAVLVAAGGAWLGYPIVDPIIGLLIGVAIVFITRDAIVTMWYRLMDAVDPKLVDQAEQSIRSHTDVRSVERLRMRWVGHALHLDADVSLDSHLTMKEADQIADQVTHGLYHALPNLTDVSLTPVSGSRNLERATAHHHP